MDRDTWWWRLVDLDPAILRGVITGVLGLIGAVGILISPDLPDQILGVWVPMMALIQALWTKPSVTANARVVVEAPDPIHQPGLVVPGAATTTASNSEIIDAAKDVPRG